MSSTSPIDRTASAYSYPLLLKQLLHAPLACAPDQEIVYRDSARYTYRTLRERIHRLAGALHAFGVRPGDTVAVMDWDSNRYLEAYFAVPMMGAVLMTFNVRLSPDQVLYTLNHARANAVLVHTDFVPVLQSIRGQLETLDRYVLIDDSGTTEPPAGFAGEYEAMLADASSDHAFPDFDENTRATTFYTAGAGALRGRDREDQRREGEQEAAPPEVRERVSGPCRRPCAPLTDPRSECRARDGRAGWTEDRFLSVQQRQVIGVLGHQQSRQQSAVRRRRQLSVRRGRRRGDAACIGWAARDSGFMTRRQRRAGIAGAGADAAPRRIAGSGRAADGRRTPPGRHA